MSEDGLKPPVANSPHFHDALRWLRDFQDVLCEFNATNSLFLARHGLTTSGYHALLTVWLCGSGGITVTGLGHRLRLGTSTATELANRLERQCWIRRRQKITDRRSFLLEMTPEGRDLIEAACETHLANLKNHRAEMFGLIKALELDLRQIAAGDEREPGLFVQSRRS